jgi:hypothetical protein
MPAFFMPEPPLALPFPDLAQGAHPPPRAYTMAPFSTRSTKGHLLMKKTSLCIAAVIAALSGPVLAQGTTAPAAKASDPVVQMRNERRSNVFSKGRAAAQAERNTKVRAAEEAALKDPANKGKDPLVVRRDARSKAMRETKPDFDAQMKKLSDERRAAFAAADQKAKAAGK